MAAVYSILSAGIPRSGGDYVWSTHILGPFFGSVQFVFLFVTTIIVGVGLSTFSAVTIALSQLFFGLGASTNNAGLVSAASALRSPGLGYPVSMLLVVVETVIALFGLRVFAWFQRIATIIFLITNVVFIALLFTVNSSAFPGLFNSAMKLAGSSATYSGIINQATSHNFPTSGFSLTNTLLAAIPWGFLTFTGFNYGAYLAGETKNVRASMTRASFFPSS